MTTENFIFFEEIIVLLLLIASVVAVVARRLRVPYTVGLVIIGLAITLKPQQVEFTSQIIMLLLVPPLVLEAAIFFELYY